MNKKVAQLAALIADKLYAGPLAPMVETHSAMLALPDSTIIEGNRADLIKTIGDILQVTFYPERCEGCGDRICPSCGEHMVPPIGDVMQEAVFGYDETQKIEAEDWDFCPDCMLYVKQDGTEAAVPGVGSQDLRVIQIQAQKRIDQSFNN